MIRKNIEDVKGIIMLEKEISNYNDLLTSWEASNSKRLEKFINTSNPNEFRFMFKQLIFELLNYDKLWNELNSYAIANLSGFINMANHLKLIPPEKFKIEMNGVGIPIRSALEENNQIQRSISSRKRFSGRIPQNGSSEKTDGQTRRRHPPADLHPGGQAALPGPKLRR